MRNIKNLGLWQKMCYNFPSYKKGLYNTLLISIDGLLIGFLLALFLVGTKTKVTNTRTNNTFVKACYKMISKCVDTYIWLLKGVPIAAQAMLVWFSNSLWWPSKGLMPDLFPQINQIHAALFVITLNAGASLTMILMQNIKFVDKGQIEAAFSLGMTQRQTFYNIIFPQALKKSVPFVITQFITNIKDCTFFAFIGLVEMGWIANRNMGITADVITPFVLLSIIYLVLIQCNNTLAKYLEKKLNPSFRPVISV
ncbi:ABC-type amino acid transport system, permease [Onion yellows phytoplasma OY-M]|uniref:ABC-type amino acid transport system, permease n=1 Tax=Onion yellows phytoplasma (strain OY-M) TaxID=262768 RepID=Q6YPT6_ONYPE|nr:ABC-type amino acid transport system, permease [Onion yellows phytoplasma OY-M]